MNHNKLVQRVGVTTFEENLQEVPNWVEAVRESGQVWCWRLRSWCCRIGHRLERNTIMEQENVHICWWAQVLPPAAVITEGQKDLNWLVVPFCRRCSLLYNGIIKDLQRSTQCAPARWSVLQTHWLLFARTPGHPSDLQMVPVCNGSEEQIDCSNMYQSRFCRFWKTFSPISPWVSEVDWSAEKDIKGVFWLVRSNTRWSDWRIISALIHLQKSCKNIKFGRSPEGSLWKLWRISSQAHVHLIQTDPC